MKRVAYHGHLDARAPKVTMAQSVPTASLVERRRRPKRLHRRYVALGFEERGRRFASVLEMRDAKYKQYAAKAASCANIVGVRYEDLAADPAFLFETLAVSGGLPCGHGAGFVAATNHAKFGVETAAEHADARHVWTNVEWAAVARRVDAAFEASLGYAYGAAPGDAAVAAVPTPTWLTLPP